MKISNRFLLSLVCLIVALVLPMLQVQAAEDIDTENNIYSFNFFGSYSSDNGDVPFESSCIVEGKNLRFISFRRNDSNYFSCVAFAFSPVPFYFTNEYTGRILVQQSVTVDGCTVYYRSIGGFSGGADDEFWTVSGFPNLNYCSGFPDDKARTIAEDMARAGYYDYDDSEWATDRPSYDSNKLQFSSSLGYLQGVQYKNVTPTDVFPYQIYSQISWDNSNDDFKDAYVQFAADMTYKVGARIYSESMSIFNSYSIPYSDGKYTFLMSEVLNGSVVGSNATIKKVDFYYVRLVKYDRENSVFLYGGWTRIDTNKFTVDTIAFDEEKQDYYIDSDSDSSYSDQMGIDGNYGTTTWGDLSSASADSFKWFFSMLKDLFGMMGSFPSMLKTVFSFLPSAYINCLSLLLMACIIMRILGR